MQTLDDKARHLLFYFVGIEAWSMRLEMYGQDESFILIYVIKSTLTHKYVDPKLSKIVTTRSQQRYRFGLEK